MNTKNPKVTTVKKRINHDSMWISCHFPSGGNFKYRVRRYDTTLEFAFSNSDELRASQLSVFTKWISANHTTSYGDLFQKIEEICNTCISGKQLISKMKSS
jgi:hypothetical protein